MISLLLTDLKLADVNNFANVDTATLEAACSELDATQLKRILRVYTNADEMFTQRYLHGSNQNIKTLVDIGKAIDDTPEQAEHMMNRLLSRETLYFRCLVEVYREWHKKSRQPSTVGPVDEFGLAIESQTDPVLQAFAKEKQQRQQMQEALKCRECAEKETQQMEEALTEIKVVD